MTFSKSQPVFKSKSSTDSEVTFKARPKMFESSGKDGFFGLCGSLHIFLYLCLPVCPTGSLSVSPFAYLSVYLQCLSALLQACLCPSASLHVYVCCMSLSKHMLGCLPVHPSVHICMSLSIHLSIVFLFRNL
jgi:hypothetical protein